MRDIKVASRYAKSLLGISIEQKSLEEVYNDMQMINSICTQNRDLELLLKSPVVKTDKKSAILSEVFGKEISQISNTFISIILTKKREGLLADIADAFIDAYKVHKEITTATVTSAITLTKEQKAAIEALLKAQGNKTIELTEVIDKDIIGGMIVRVGDKQVDESIKRKLTDLEMEFSDNPYIKEF